MSVSTSLASYEDCFDVLDQAMEQPNGIRVEVSSQGDGMQLYSRLNYARTVDRANNRAIYDTGHKLHGTSAYDLLIVRMPRNIDGKWWIYIEPRKISGRIEALPK